MAKELPPNGGGSEFGETTHFQNGQPVDVPRPEEYAVPVPTAAQLMQQAPEEAPGLFNFHPLRTIGRALKAARRQFEGVELTPPAPRPIVVTTLEKTIDVRPRRLPIPRSKRAWLLTGAAALTATLTIAELLGHHVSHGHDSCSSLTTARLTVGGKGTRGAIHRFFGDQDNASWAGAASLLSGQRYVMDPEALRRANPDFVTFQPSGRVSPNLAPGTYCLKLPAPDIGGQDPADGQKDMLEEAKLHKLDITVLLAQNRGLGLHPDSVPAAGTVINVSSKDNPLSPRLVLQLNSSPGLGRFSGQEFTEITKANRWAIEHGQIGKGKPLFLPPPESVAPGISFQAILRAYHLIK